MTSATTGDGVILIDAGGNLTVQTVTANGAGHNVRLRALGGDLTVGTVTAAADVVALSATGAILDGNGAANNVTALSLSLSAGTDIATADALETTVSNVAWNAGAGGISLTNTGALTVTSVTAFGATVTGGAGAGAATITAASPMTFAADTTSGGTLTATTADNNGIHIDNITVNAGVTVQSTGGDVVFHAGDDVIVNGTVQSGARDVNLVAGFGDTDGEGVIAINGTASATATVALNVSATNAALPAGTPIATEAAAGTISAAGLLLLNLPAGAPGPFSLDGTTANAVGTIAATTQAEVDYRNSGALTVGTVTSVPEGVTSFGVFTTNHDATLCTITGDISLTQGLNVGTATARLASAGAVTQTAAGKITAANLGVTATGDIGLDQAAPTNHVTGTVALNTGGAIRFQDDAAFMVGTVTAIGCFGGASGIGGNDVNICSAGDIMLTAPVAAAGGTARIQSGGNVSQTAAGTITAVNLGVRANGNIALCVAGAPNAVTGTFAADASGGPAGSSVMFLDGSGYTVGTVTAAGCFTADAVGVRSNNGAIDLVNTGGSFAFVQPINAGTGTVRINSAGAVTQTAGAITAGDLAVVANGTIGLCLIGTPNVVGGNVAATSTAAGAAIQFLDASGFTVGTVAADACAVGAVGVVAANGDIDLVSTAGPIVLTQAVNAGTGTVRINSGAAVTQTGGGAGAITAGNLAVRANGTVDLCQVANTVAGMFAAQDTGAAAAVMFLDTVGITVGTVADDACALGATGVVTTNGDIDLVSNGSIAFPNGLNAGTGTVRLNAGTTVAQSGGTVAAQNLAVVANGAIDLAGPANAVTGIFAALDTAAGATIRFQDGPGFTVGAVAADACAVGATGVTTTNGDATLVSASGAVQLQQFVNTGTATTRLQVATGVSSIAATGIVTAAALGVQNTTSGDIQLDQANVVPVFAALNAAPGGGINYRTTGTLSLDAVSADGTLFAAVSGVTTTGTGGTTRLQATGLSQTANGIVTTDVLGVQNTAAGDVILDKPNSINNFAAANALAGGRITLNDSAALNLDAVAAQGTFAAVNGVTTNAGITYLQAAGNVTQTAAGLVNSAALAVVSTAGGTIRLDQANTVATFAANDTVAGGLVNFQTTGGLTLDTVTSGSALLPQIAGLTTTTGTALLHAANGVGQTVTGLVNSSILAVRNDTAGDISLRQTDYTTNVGNQVGTFAAVNGAAGGRLDLATFGTLTLGTVPGDGTFVQVRGLTTNNGGSNLLTGTDFTAVDTNYAVPFITLGSGNFLVNPGQTPVPAAQVQTVVRTVTFNAEAQTTGTFRLGVPAPGDAPPPPPPATVPDQSPVPANPTGAATVPPAPDNPFRETFNVRPSANVQILINGNAPTAAPGDTLNLILTDLPANSPIQLTPGGIGAGRFDFPNTRKAVPYTGIETIGGFNVLATSIQTGPLTYTINASAPSRAGRSPAASSAGRSRRTRSSFRPT